MTKEDIIKFWIESSDKDYESMLNMYKIKRKKVSDLFIPLLPTAFNAAGSFYLWIFKTRGNRYEQIRS